MPDNDSGTQKAQVINKFGIDVEYTDIPIPEPLEDELLVHIQYSGVCHTDVAFMRNQIPLPGLKVPMVGGHEGAGIVVKVGNKVDKFKIGDKVGVKIITRTCNKCEYCHDHLHENLCDNVEQCVVNKYGTFLQYNTISEAQALKIPNNVDMKLAATFQCAGVTIYRALKETGVKPGGFVALTGAGGGLGSFGLQYAKAMGMRPIAVDINKEKHCLELGAEHYVDVKEPNHIEKIQKITNGGAHGVVVIAPDNESYQESLKYVRKAGVIVLVGIPEDSKFTIDINEAILRTIQIKGTCLGTRSDFVEAMGFIERGLINIPIETYALTDLKQVLERIDKAEINGRVVLDTNR